MEQPEDIAALLACCMLFEYGFIPGGVAASGTVQRLRTNLPDFERLLVEPRTATDKRRAPCWSPARYRASEPGIAPRRLDAVEALTCLVLDVDDGTPLRRLVEFAQTSGCRWWAHTSWSHREDHPKARLIWPLEEPVPVAEWGAAWGAAQRWAAANGITVDGQCKDPSRAYLLPATPPGGEAPLVVRSSPYLPRLNLRDTLARYPAPAPPPAPFRVLNPYTAPKTDGPQPPAAHGAYLARVEGKLALAAPGGRNRAAMDAGWALGARELAGLSPADADTWFSRLVAAATATGLPSIEAHTAVLSGRRRALSKAP